MGIGMKSTLLALIRMLAVSFSLIPGRWRVGFIKGLIVVDSRIGDSANAMRRAFSISDLTDQVIAERATVYGNGEHPKHRLMRYHDFRRRWRVFCLHFFIVRVDSVFSRFLGDCRLFLILLICLEDFDEVVLLFWRVVWLSSRFAMFSSFLP